MSMEDYRRRDPAAYAHGARGAAAPIPLSDERLKCRFCDATFPLVYANVSDKHRTPRDGHTRLVAHVRALHWAERHALGGHSISRDVRGGEPRP